MSGTIPDRLFARLDAAGVDYEVVRHEPVRTSAQAAAVRGTPRRLGAKSLVCKGDAGFLLCVVPGDRRLASNRLRRARGWRGLRFADRDELRELTGLVPGSVPPFGSLFGLPTVLDAELARRPRLWFNAGDRAVSASLRVEDYLRLEEPRVEDVGEPE